MIVKIAPLFLVAFALIGCDRKKDEFRNKAVEPSISGVWAGTININGVVSAVSVTLGQDNVRVTGSYTADGASPALAGSGTVSGATTGPTFSLDITAGAPACVRTLQMGGQNSGTELSFNLTGTDCAGAPLRGEAFLAKS